MLVGILGAGFVGQSMARALTAIGHEVVISSREPDSERMRDLIDDLGSRARAASVASTGEQADVVFLALPWSAIPDAVAQVADWTGKILIDAANDFRSARSTSEDLEELAAGARVVKSFNTIGAEHYLDPSFDGYPATMLLCGDDGEAKTVVASLAAELGFDPVDVGGLEHAPLLNGVAALWVHHMLRTGERDFAVMLKPKGAERP